MFCDNKEQLYDKLSQNVPNTKTLSQIARARQFIKMHKDRRWEKQEKSRKCGVL